jgi:hypothetical protein
MLLICAACRLGTLFQSISQVALDGPDKLRSEYQRVANLLKETVLSPLENTKLRIQLDILQQFAHEQLGPAVLQDTDVVLNPSASPAPSSQDTTAADTPTTADVANTPESTESHHAEDTDSLSVPTSLDSPDDVV